MKSSFIDFLNEIVKQYPQLKIAMTFQDWETDFLRFCNSEVNYNISKNTHSLAVQVYKGKRSYTFKLVNPSQKDVCDGLDKASELIDTLPEDPDFVDLEDNLEKTAEESKDNNVEKVSLADKIAILEEISHAVKPHGFKIFGTFICNYETNYIINSNGLNKKNVNSPIMLELKAVADKNDVTVIESYGSESMDTFDLNSFKSNLADKVQAGTQDIVDVEPDYYEVILAPRCVQQYAAYLTFVAMTAGSYDKKRSYFQDKAGQKVFPESINISDDPGYPGLIHFDYNSEGHIYKKIALIEKGVFRNFLVSNYYSYKTGLKKSGADGKCLVMDKGADKLEDMLKSVKKGLFISNLHYMNFINPKETSITGLTRDGTFLIEDGKMTKVVNNLRFTVRIVDVFKNVTAIEDKLHIIPSSGNYGSFSIDSAAMPHIKVSKFKITSSTETI